MLTGIGSHMLLIGTTYRRCRHCSTKRAEKRTKCMCSACNLPLCLDACFSDCCVYLCLRQQSVLCVLVHFVFGLLHNNDCGNVRNVSEFISGEIWFLHHKKSLISHPHPYPHRSTQPKCFPHPSSSVMHSPIFTFLLILP